MPTAQQLARQAASEVGLDPGLFSRLVRQESGFNANARSPAGAMGFTQLMPATARSLSQRYGIDTSSPYGNLLGGAYYLKEQLDRFGSPSLALAAYNAGPGAVSKYGGIPPYKETQNYVRSIMGGGGMSPSSASLAVPSAMASMGASSDNLRQALLQNLLGIATTGKVDPVAMLQGITQGISMDRAAGGSSMSPIPQGFGVPLSMAGGKVKIAPGADRAGVSLDPRVINFVGQVSGVDGRPLTIGTGTNHNQFVVGTNRQSAHWTGEAADIPATGAELTRLGQSALVAAGMDPVDARKAKGGVYNINGWQILFNTRTGGNHFNHLHVGFSG